MSPYNSMQGYRPGFDVDAFTKTFADKSDAERDAANAAFTAKYGKSLEQVATENSSRTVQATWPMF